ncbi:MAG: hypothetical protein ABIP46_13595 [Polaromonas sp.]
MPSNEKIAVAAHLHVLLRRKTGRVTDTEWMATNHEYAAEVSRFAREKAAEDGHADLIAWADKLEEVMAMPEAKTRVPLVKQAADAIKERRIPPHPAGAGASVPDRQSAQTVNTEEETYPESGFIESTFGVIFGDGDPNHSPRDPNAPRYLKGLR